MAATDEPWNDHQEMAERLVNAQLVDGPGTMGVETRAVLAEMRRRGADPDVTTAGKFLWLGGVIGVCASIAAHAVEAANARGAGLTVG